MTRDARSIRPLRPAWLPVMRNGPGPLQGCTRRRDRTGRRLPPTRGGRRMRLRLIAPLTAALVAGTIGLTATSAVAAPAPAPAATAAAVAPVSVPLTGTASDGSQFVGTFAATNFSNRGGQLNV